MREAEAEESLLRTRLGGYAARRRAADRLHNEQPHGISKSFSADGSTRWQRRPTPPTKTSFLQERGGE